jgi:hypothetical protein
MSGEISRKLRKVLVQQEEQSISVKNIITHAIPVSVLVEYPFS